MYRVLNTGAARRTTPSATALTADHFDRPSTASLLRAVVNDQVRTPTAADQPHRRPHGYLEVNRSRFRQMLTASGLLPSRFSARLLQVQLTAVLKRLV